MDLLRLRSFFFLFLLLLGTGSTAQVQWQRNPSNPVIPAWSGNINDTNSFRYTYAPSVLFDSASNQYKMWFAALEREGSTFNVWYATSPDGIVWSVNRSGPVISVGPTGSFDSRWVMEPFVIYVNSEFRMYYSGYDGTVYQTGLATSADGVNWTKYSSNPILQVVPGTWESVTSDGPKVRFTGSSYIMMYSGFDGVHYNIGLATSIDGIHFTKHPSNPVLRRGNTGDWDANSVFTNALVYNEEKLCLFFNGGPYAPVGFATSADEGVSWVKYPGNPVFTTGTPGSWDGSRVAPGSLIVTEGQFRYWYTAYSSSRDAWQIGYAIGTTAPSFVLSDTAAIWRFDEQSGSLVSDDSPNGNDGTAYGTTIVPGRFANARHFNGYSDHVWIGDPMNGSLDFANGQSFTIEAWFKTTSLNNQQILRKGLAPVQGYELKTNGGRVEVRVGNREDSHWPDTLLTIRSTNLYNDGNWHKATIVRDQAQRKLFLYVDEMLAAPSITDPIQFPLSNDRPFTIGRWETIPSYFSGCIDEVRVFRDVRHPGTVMSDTIALWHMDETSGNAVLDASLYHNDGTAYGTTIVSGRFGNARTFNGISDFVQVPNPINGSFNFGSEQSFTLQVWFKTVQEDTGEIIRRGLAPLPGFALRILDGHIQGIVGVQEPYIRITSAGSQYNDDEWHLATLIRDRSLSEVFLYVDGVQAASPVDDNLQAAISNERPLTMGQWENLTRPTSYHGAIDEVAIFRGARHPGEFELPDIDVLPLDIDFGPVLIGESATRSVEISNRGGGDPLIITGITSSNLRFTSDTDSLVVPFGQTYVIHLSYASVEETSDTGSLFVASNDPVEPVVQVHLTGRGFQVGSSPVINQITDIPNDQGKQVRLIWYRSILDSLGGSAHVTAYGIWRRVDDPGPLAPPPGTIQGVPYSIHGHTLLITANELWDFIASVPAVQFAQYSYVAPTLYDSTLIRGMHWSVFRVSAHADNSVVYFSEPDSGYSVDNIPPSTPHNLGGSLGGGTVFLTWDVSPDPDLSYYIVHRSAMPGFIPDPTTRIGSPQINSFADASPGNSPAVYYRVIAIDSAGNTSNFSDVLGVILTDIGGGGTVPDVFALHQNYPNPFNPETIISYDVPVASHVTVAIFDVNGQEVERLVNGLEQPGRHFVTWAPHAVASGVYLCRMTAGGSSFTQKLVILK